MTTELKEDLSPDTQDYSYDELYDELSLIDQEPSKNELSASSLKKYLQCQMRYYFEYVKKFKIEEFNLNMTFGTTIHKVLEHMNRETALGRELTKGELQEQLRTSWDINMSGLVKNLGYLNPKQIEGLRPYGEGLIDRHYQSAIRKGMAPIVYRPKYSSNYFIPAVELPFRIPSVGLRTGTYLKNGDKWILKGYIDVVNKASKTSRLFDEEDIILVDYKTARADWLDFTVKTDIQILFYSYVIRYLLRNENLFPHIHKDREDLVGISCLIKKLKSKSPKQYGVLTHHFIRISDEEIDFFERIIERVFEELLYKGTDYRNYIPSPSEWNCKFCPYKEPCLEIRKGGDESYMDEWMETNKSLILDNKRG